MIVHHKVRLPNMASWTCHPGMFIQLLREGSHCNQSTLDGGRPRPQHLIFDGEFKVQQQGTIGLLTLTYVLSLESNGQLCPTMSIDVHFLLSQYHLESWRDSDGNRPSCMNLRRAAAYFYEHQEPCCKPVSISLHSPVNVSGSSTLVRTHSRSLKIV